MPRTATTYGPLRSKKDLAALLDILAPTFGFSRPQGDDYARIVGPKNYRVMREGTRGGTIVGGCALLPMGQCFGGKSVPMWGVAAVAIAPEHRGSRTATTLMQHALKEMHTRGIPISSLYPATLPLYRSVGYEHAGGRYEIRIPAKPLLIRDRCETMRIRPITHKDKAVVRQLYQTRALCTAGNLDRSEFIWHRVTTPRGQKAQGYLITNAVTKKPEGYLYYVQTDSHLPADAAHAPLAIHLTDHVALTPQAGTAMLKFLSNHRSMIECITFHGSPDDPVLKLLPDRTYSARLLDHWMLRIVDVKGALESRGYSPCVHAEIHLDIAFDQLPANYGRFVLKVADGKAKVSEGGRGDVRMNVRGFASLYAGHCSPHDLLTMGLLEVASRKSSHEADAILATLGGVFAGPSPWLGDIF